LVEDQRVTTKTIPVASPVVAALLLLTVATGFIDAASYLGLGHVFVANMTGNVVFFGFAANPNSGLSALMAAIAFAGFIGGAFAGGVAGRIWSVRARWWPTIAFGVQGAVLIGAAVAACYAPPAPAGDGRAWLVATLAVAFGLQNATVRKIAVPDLTTTVLTLTVTGLAADSRLGGGPGAKPVRRVSSIAAMLAGAAAGAVLIQVSFALVIAAAACCAVAAAAIFACAPTPAD
jgi:uncharacterized membrane protein YoaK (UPF0700 family)